jgi:hypothetical protein
MIREREQIMEKILDVGIVYDQHYTKDDIEEVFVVVGDGTQTFNEDYPFDERVYFYFHDQAEFEQATTGVHNGVDFMVVKVYSEMDWETQ